MKILLFFIIIYSTVVSLTGFYNLVNFENFDLIILQLNLLYITLSVLYLYIYRKKNIFCPELIISIMLYMACFIMSVVIFSDISNVYIFPKYDIVRGISLSLLGWVFFIIGSIIANKKSNLNKPIKKIDYYTDSIRLFFVFFSCLVLMYFLIFDSPNYITRYQEGGELTESVFWLTLFLVITTYYEFFNLHRKKTNDFRSFIKNVNKIYLIVVLIVVFFFLFTGNRSEVLQIILPVILLYHTYIRKFRTKQIVFYIIFSLLLFNIIREVRSDDKSINYSEFVQVQSFTKDFIPTNAALPVLINYTENYGSAAGHNAFLQILSVVPFLQGLVVNIYDYKSVETSSVVNSTELRGEDYSSGQGTNIIGDLYYTFNIYGVISGMFLLGYTFIFLFNRFTHNRINVYQSIAFLIIFGNIVYLVRVEFFYIFRLVSFSLITLFLIRSLPLFRYLNK